MVWTINSILVILLQGVITSFIIQRIHPFSALAIGVIFIAAGIGSLYWSSLFIHFVISGVIFIVGEMLIMPTIDSTISQLSRAELIGLFFGLANFVSGLGEAVGNFSGGKLLDLGVQINWLPWAIYGVSGIFIALIISRLKNWGLLQVTLQEAAKKRNAPEHAPRVPLAPAHHPSHPYDRWESGSFLRFRKKRVRE